MKPTLKICGEDDRLTERLNLDGFDAKQVKGGIIVDLPVDEEEINTYKLPEVGDLKHLLLIDVAERGGGEVTESQGCAEIICGPNGEALRPYYIPKRGDLANGVHAHFAYPKVVVIEATGGKVKITSVQVVKNVDKQPYVAKVNIKELWHGEPDFRPTLYDKFLKAIEAACDKSNCPACTEPHFIRSMTEERSA